MKVTSTAICGSDVVIDCVGMDGKMSTIELIETALKMQGGSKSAIEIATLLS